MEDSNDWGLKLVQLRGPLMPNGIGPVEVEWMPGTEGTAISDFPYFRSNILCMSIRAHADLHDLIDKCGQWISLTGLDYIAFYCTNIVDVLDNDLTDRYRSKSGISSVHATSFVPILKHAAVSKGPIFRVPEIPSKHFVDEDFIDIYRIAGLTGLEFYPVLLS